MVTGIVTTKRSASEPALDNTNSGDSRNSISPIIEYEGRGNGAVCFTPSMHPDARESRFNPADIPTTFNSVGGNMTQLSITACGESGIDILYRSVVMEALHDSGERFPEPACHPGTRTMVLEELKIWSVDTNPESAIMWLYGAAGMGKSAIAQMFAGDCQAEGRLGASFFFRRGHPNRGTWKRLFTTLAYQLATSVSELLLPVQRAVEDDKLVVGRTMVVQFQKLFLSPFQNTPNLQSMPIIVLDGLDECKDHHVQQQILLLFITGIRNHYFPIRLLITSRPEPHIRETLQSEDSLAICRHFELSADDSAYADIRMYLWDEFSRIYREFLARGIDLGPNWPAPQAVTHLVKKSSGIFIYAVTVIRFIGDEYTHPAERLAAVLSLDPRSTAPLDDLYTEILSVVPPEATRLRILHAIWQGTQDNFLAMRPEHVRDSAPTFSGSLPSCIACPPFVGLCPTATHSIQCPG
ncbi:NACHT domain-containing protein [Mycena venus]|uniref:NACHT domain-containing protein n=1 Tax=Mycena venus TaxID=2733690 RepID=A0A8H6Y6H4_9AGAR|nr:NACHT domain-containing protein [Mycena venus]